MARRKILLVTAEVFADMLRGHDMSRVETDFPADAKIIGCGWDEQTQSIRLAVECPSFDEVPDGYFAPNLNVAITRHVTYEAALYELIRHDRETTAS